METEASKKKKRSNSREKRQKNEKYSCLGPLSSRQEAASTQQTSPSLYNSTLQSFMMKAMVRVLLSRTDGSNNSGHQHGTSTSTTGALLSVLCALLHPPTKHREHGSGGQVTDPNLSAPACLNLSW